MIELPSMEPAPRRRNFEVRIGGAMPKAALRRLTSVYTASGDFACQIPLGITDGLPEGRQNTGRPALAGAIVTAGGVLFVGATDDNYFRALEAKTGKQLWVTKFDRRANADPMTYRRRDVKQYVVTLFSFSLPRVTQE